MTTPNDDRSLNDQEAWALREMSLWMENDQELYEFAKVAHTNAYYRSDFTGIVQLVNKTANKASEDLAAFPGHVRRELKERMVGHIPPEFDNWLGHWDVESRELSEPAWKVREGLHVPGAEQPMNPRGPQTKAELWRQMGDYIEQEGLHYALVNYTSPESQNCDQLDPELAKMWREFVAGGERIEKHVGYRKD